MMPLALMTVTTVLTTPLKRTAVRGKLILFTSALALASLVSPVAHAYIPNSHTIIGRLVRNSGKGVYSVDQEVQFRTAGEPLVLKEHWTIENGDTMHLTVTSAQPSSQISKTSTEAIHYEAFYREGRKLSVDLGNLQGGPKTSLESAEFVEPLFYTRGTGGFISELVRAHIVPPGSLRERAHFTKPEQAKYVEEPDVRLGRTSGVVAWVFGDPNPNPSGKPNPAAWIEQDAFTLRRIRFPSEAEVAADRYSAYANSLRLPRERVVTWADNSVSIHVISVKHLNSMPPKDLTLQTRTANLPEVAQVKEFYSRFR